MVSSRHGEFARTFGLLRGLVLEGEVSPAEFSMAVHHSLAGLLSIHRKEHLTTTAVAAGADSFAYGLLEAALILKDSGRPVLFLHFDEPLPDIYGAVANGLAGSDAAKECVLALLLLPEFGDRMTIERIAGPTIAAVSHEGLAQSSKFLEFLQSTATMMSVPGTRGSWRWARAS